MRLPIILLLSFVISLHAEKQGDKINPEAMLDSITVIKESQPDDALRKAFYILAEFAKADLPDSIIAETHLEIASILNKQGLPAQSMEYYISALDYYNNAGRILETGWFHNDIGNIYFHQGMYGKAQQHYQKAREIFIEREDLYPEATVVNNLALIAIEKDDFNKAMILFNEALELRVRYGKQPYLIAHSYNYIADLYLRMGNMKEAMAYYQKVIDIGITEGAGNVRGLSLQAMGDIYFKMDEKQTAIEHFRLAEESFISDYNPKYLAELYIRLAEIYETEGVADSAVKYLNKALPIVEQHRFVKLNISVLNQLIELNEDLGKQEKILSYYEQLNRVIQSRYKTELRQSLERAEIQIELSDYKQKLVEKEFRLRSTKLERNFVTIIGFILTLLGWTFYKKILKEKEVLKHQEEILTQNFKIEQLSVLQKEKEIETKNNELITKATFIQQKNDIIGVIIKDLKYQISLLDNHEDHKNFNPLITSLEETQKTEDSWIEFEKQFTETYPSFLKMLAQHFTMLTVVDLKMCAYLKMNLNTKDISQLTGLTIRAIEIRRHRLRKKINIQKGVNLNKFLSSIDIER